MTKPSDDPAVVLRRYRNGLNKGRETALWDAFLFCKENDVPQPRWLSEALERYARDRANGRSFKGKAGRPRGMRSNPKLDFYIFMTVNDLVGEGRVSSKAKAYEEVKRRLREEGIYVGKPEKEDDAMRQAYDRGKEMFDDYDTYYVSDFSDESGW